MTEQWEVWEKIGQDTWRMRVPGGYLYRYNGYDDMREDSEISCAMVFVPLSLAEADPKITRIGNAVFVK